VINLGLRTDPVINLGLRTDPVINLGLRTDPVINLARSEITRICWSRPLGSGFGV
jgi:hypothetical protein